MVGVNLRFWDTENMDLIYELGVLVDVQLKRKLPLTTEDLEFTTLCFEGLYVPYFLNLIYKVNSLILGILSLCF